MVRASTHYPTVYGKDTIATDNPGKPHILSWRVLRDPYLRGGGGGGGGKLLYTYTTGPCDFRVFRSKVKLLQYRYGLMGAVSNETFNIFSYKIMLPYV